MAVGEGKGGNKGRAAKYSTRPATLKTGAPFRHSQPQQEVGSRGTPPSRSVLGTAASEAGDRSDRGLNNPI